MKCHGVKEGVISHSSFVALSYKKLSKSLQIVSYIKNTKEENEEWKKKNTLTTYLKKPRVQISINLIQIS